MEERRNFSGKFSFLFNLLMIILYITAGLMLIFASPVKELIPEVNSTGLGIVLVLYAIYRLYRLYKKYNAANHHISPNEQ